MPPPDAPCLRLSVSEGDGERGGKRKASEPAKPQDNERAAKERRLTPRERSQLELLARAPELQNHRDARGRRRAVSVDTSQLISGALGSLVAESSIVEHARSPSPARDTSAAPAAAPQSLDQMLAQPDAGTSDDDDDGTRPMAMAEEATGQSADSGSRAAPARAPSG